MITEVTPEMLRRPKHVLPRNVHQTGWATYHGRFELFGLRWYTGCRSSVEEAATAVALLRRRLEMLVAQGWTPTNAQEVAVEMLRERA